MFRSSGEEFAAVTTREAVTKMVLSARALPNILRAQQALRAWIKAHPEDKGMRDGFEQLSLMQDIAEMGQYRSHQDNK